MSEHKRQLLFVSGASLVGQNVLASLAGRRQDIRLVAINSEAREPALYDFDEAWLAPEAKADPEGFRQRFFEVYERSTPELVIPCRDDDILFLAHIGEAMPDLSRNLLCGSVETAAAMLDKWNSWTFSHDHDLPFVPTQLCDSRRDELHAFARAHGFPLIAKPREGFASRGVVLLLNEAHLDGVLGWAGYILQKYLGDGEQVLSYVRQVESAGVPLFHSFEAIKLSIQALIGPQGDCLAVWPTHNAMKQGRSESVVAISNQEAIALGQRCAAAFSRAGWRGPLNIQCQLTPAGEMYIYEYNGRFTGATSARYLLGMDEVGMALAAFAGVNLSTQALSGVVRTVKRYPQSRPVDETKIDILLRDGVWHAAD